MLRPDTRNETILLLKRLRPPARTGATASNCRRSASSGRTPAMSTGSRTRWATIRVRLGSIPARPAPATMSRSPSSASSRPLIPSYRSRLADMLGLRFIATGVPIDRIDLRSARRLAALARTPDGFIYENRTRCRACCFATEAQAADFDRLLKDGAGPMSIRTARCCSDEPALSTAVRRPGKARMPATATARSTSMSCP